MKWESSAAGESRSNFVMVGKTLFGFPFVLKKLLLFELSYCFIIK